MDSYSWHYVPSQVIHEQFFSGHFQTKEDNTSLENQTHRSIANMATEHRNSWTRGKARDSLRWELSHCYFNKNGNCVTEGIWENVTLNRHAPFHLSSTIPVQAPETMM